MTQTWYNVYLDGFGFSAKHVQSDPAEINNRTRGSSTTFNLYVPENPDDLVVASGETYEVPSGTVQVWNNITVDGTLTVNGLLVVYGTVNSVDGTVNVVGGGINNLSTNPATELLKYGRHAGSYSLTETLNNTQRYKERLPSSPNINSLVVGLEPATDLQKRSVRGKWGLISNVTDNRTRPFTNPVVSLEIDILADYAEYSDVTAIQNDLAI